MDVYGDHAFVCSCKGDRTTRHNALRDVIHNNMVTAVFSPVLEPPHILRNSGQKPADIFTPNWADGKAACFDVAVTCPLQSKYLAHSAQTQLYAANHYAEYVKVPKYTKVVEEMGLNFIPLIFESFGGMNPVCEETLLRVARQTAHRLSIDNSVAINHLFQSVSVTLHRRNARMLLSRRNDLLL